MSETTIQLPWQNRRVHPEFRAGVSLHSHTMYSEESLQMVPRYTGKVPLLADAVRGASHQFKKRKREELDFSRAFWTPPLPPRQAYRLEQKQIQNTLQLPALVSLTDHDNIHAGAQLRVLSDFCEARFPRNGLFRSAQDILPREGFITCLSRAPPASWQNCRSSLAGRTKTGCWQFCAPE